MNDYIIIGFAIGLVVVIFLIRVVFRKDKTYDYKNYQNMSSLVPDENIKIKVRELLSKEKKIQAIKLVRENCNISLIDAKDFVEAMEKNVDRYIPVNGTYHTIAGTVEDSDKLIKMIEMLLIKGKKIHAIKLVVENKKMRLKEAKDYVESIEAKLKIK